MGVCCGPQESSAEQLTPVAVVWRCETTAWGLVALVCVHCLRFIDFKNKSNGKQEYVERQAVRL